MLKTLGIVQVRHPSGKKADSKFGRKLGGKSLLEVVVRRATDCQRLDGVVVVLAGDELDDEIRSLVPPDVSVFGGPGRDPLSRTCRGARRIPSPRRCATVRTTPLSIRC